MLGEGGAVFREAIEEITDGIPVGFGRILAEPHFLQAMAVELLLELAGHGQGEHGFLEPKRLAHQGKPGGGHDPFARGKVVHESFLAERPIL